MRFDILTLFPELFTPFLKKIKAASDVVVNLTTGGAPTMLVADTSVCSCPRALAQGCCPKCGAWT